VPGGRAEALGHESLIQRRFDTFWFESLSCSGWGVDHKDLKGLDVIFFEVFAASLLPLSIRDRIRS
jgi:hypothetical protein